MSDNDINRIQQNIEQLQDQNAIDFQQWKRLGKEIEKLEGKIKISDCNLNLVIKKIKADYESLRRLMIDENVQLQLNEKIEQNKNEINKKVNNETFQNKVDEINSQLDTITKYQDFKSGQSPKEFGAIPLHENSTFDSSDIIQGIIDTLAAREFGGILVIDDCYGVSKPIYLKEKVQIQGKAPISFFNGMIYYSDTPANIYSPRLKAINDIDDAVLIIENKDGKRKHESRSISNFVIDGNKLATHCLKLVGQNSKRQEDNTLIENIACQGATSHGVYCKETLTNKLINLNVSACNGYGVYLAYGVCDSVIMNPYIHTNQQGGVYIGQGCAYLNIDGGKIEDNYANGIQGYGCIHVYINKTQFHANNGFHILSDGASTNLHLNDALLVNANKSATGDKATVLVSNNGSLSLKGCVIGGTHYVSGVTNGGTLNLLANDITVEKGIVSNRNSIKLNEVDNIVNGKLQRYNQGSILKKITIQPSSTGSATFNDVVEFARYGTPYATLVSYELTIVSTQYAQNGASKLFKGVVNAGKAGDNYGANIITTFDTNDTNWISSVTAELIDNKDLKITIETGANVGNVSGFKEFFVYLEDKGHKSFCSIVN